MVSPASTRPLALTSTGVAAVLSRAIERWSVVGVVTVSGGEVTSGPVGGVPVTVAVLTTEPLFASAWVIVYVAVQTRVWPGSSGVAGQVTTATSASSTVTPVSVTAPVLVTVNVYGMVSPASTRPSASTSSGVPAALSTVRVAMVEVGVLVLSGSDSAAGPVGGVPDAVAVLSTDPLLTSAWVTS